MIIDIIETKAATYNDAVKFLNSVAKGRGYDNTKHNFKFENVKDNYTGEIKEGYARLIVQNA